MLSPRHTRSCLLFCQHSDVHALTYLLTTLSHVSAGFAETLLGEGIYNAVISGKYIGNAIKDSEIPDVVFEKYTDFLDGMKKELALYNRGAKVLYKKQRMSYWMLQLFFGRRFMDGYSTGKTLTEIIKGKYPFPSI